MSRLKALFKSKIQVKHVCVRDVASGTSKKHKIRISTPHHSTKMDNMQTIDDWMEMPKDGEDNKTPLWIWFTCLVVTWLLFGSWKFHTVVQRGQTTLRDTLLRTYAFTIFFIIGADQLEPVGLPTGNLGNNLVFGVSYVLSMLWSWYLVYRAFRDRRAQFKVQGDNNSQVNICGLKFGYMEALTTLYTMADYAMAFVMYLFLLEELSGHGVPFWVRFGHYVMAPAIELVRAWSWCKATETSAEPIIVKAEVKDIEKA